MGLSLFTKDFQFNVTRRERQTSPWVPMDHNTIIIITTINIRLHYAGRDTRHGHGVLNSTFENHRGKMSSLSPRMSR